MFSSTNCLDSCALCINNELMLLHNQGKIYHIVSFLGNLILK